MRISHIDYLKSLIVSIKTLPEPPAAEPIPLFPESKILLSNPSTNDYPTLFPFCVIFQSPLVSIADGKRFQRLDSEIVNGVKNIRFLKRHYIQEFKYVIDFWMRNSSEDVPSTGHSNSNAWNLGVIDQILIYLSNHRNFKTSQGVTVEIKPGVSYIISDVSENLGYYKLKTEIVFSDGLFETESVPTLAQGTFQIEEPTDMETSEEQ
ncbi:LIC10173 family protein [Leptospira alstonii]|uniref:Uncharacterized protein n=2 Tax=Leptospira alstonii TaxID=28452 RepID=M6D0T0_9LEPT|nr:hypothetical protein [Leptospira alstonii]EMJ92185.1 hypothetical protein LEP1GSC194_3500 [Leptospira alstonii serovar Sichuan str. 79601]EQA80553.1 hypothetical protein LEP1GSC193_3364 [Leptospira alstonii serovar Pingchang str. 80-412]